MNVSLTAHLEALIQEKVVTSKFGSASEVVREALMLLEARDQGAVSTAVFLRGLMCRPTI